MIQKFVKTVDSKLYKCRDRENDIKKERKKSLAQILSIEIEIGEFGNKEKRPGKET